VNFVFVSWLRNGQHLGKMALTGQGSVTLCTDSFPRSGISLAETWSHLLSLGVRSD
jgi:hypothetical protein